MATTAQSVGATAAGVLFAGALLIASVLWPATRFLRRHKWPPALAASVVLLTFIALFAGIIVLWQMRKEPRPLPEALVAQRVQAWVGIVLALLAAVIIYGYVAIFGPK